MMYDPYTPYYASYGQTNVLGVVGGTLAEQFVRDPYVQQTLVEIKEDCKDKAKVGVTEWMGENWHWLIVGGATLVGLNYLMLTAAVLPYMGRSRS